MKYLLKLTFTFILSLFIFGCSNDNVEDIENETEIANNQMIDLLNSKFGVVTTDLGNGGFKFTYPNGKFLTTSSTENSIIVTGTRLNNEIIDFDKLSANEINNLNNSKSQYFLNAINKQTFISNVNNNSNLEQGLYARPCDEHPSDEEFDDCFEREWDEFCDGFVGCVAQATNPVLIAAVVAGHCAAC